ncbi:MAG TPA: GNAT family N-acetyltransferase [Candidatus Nanoarchaeia archaeon]|nr:GNAT family N-acetyltransferase [Candidatus Nanoarchaeia archaeon]
MKVKLRKFNIIDGLRMMKLKFNPKTSIELEKSIWGYIRFEIEKILKRKSQYKFAILVDNKFAGSIGAFKYNHHDEIGYYILPKYRKKGVATIAVRQILKKIPKDLGIKTIRASPNKSNLASIKVLKNNKFKLIKTNKKNLMFEKSLR